MQFCVDTYYILSRDANQSSGKNFAFLILPPPLLRPIHYPLSRMQQKARLCSQELVPRRAVKKATTAGRRRWDCGTSGNLNDLKLRAGRAGEHAIRRFKARSLAKRSCKCISVLRDARVQLGSDYTRTAIIYSVTKASRKRNMKI